MTRRSLQLGLVSIFTCALLPACPRTTGSEGDGETEAGPIELDEGGPKLDMTGGESGDNDGQQETEETDGCAEIDVSVEPTIPTVVLLVDQSGSMDNDFAGQPRWDAVYATLMDPDAGVVKPLESSVRFGLALYSSVDGFEGGECPMLTEVEPALNNHMAIDAIYEPADPIDETPTGESLAAVANALAASPDDGPKVIVLATDGEPDTCAEPNPQNGQEEALAAAQAAHAAGVETYVISVGDDVSQDHLQEMANAGVGLDPQGVELATYYQALDTDDLIDAFDEIISGVTSCVFELEGIVDLDLVCEGTVELDGVELECMTDWHLLDPSTLELLGDACETLQDGEPHTLTATWPCGAVSIP